MTKKRSHQQRKVLRNKITDWLLFFGLLLFTAVFLFFGVRQISVVNNIERDQIETYTGTYTMDMLHMTKNMKYLFTLDNGDQILADNLTNRQALNGTPLNFTYTGPKNGLRFKYSAIEISSPNKTLVLLSREDGQQEAKSQIFSYFFVFSLCFIGFVLSSLAVFDIPSFLSKLKKRKQKQTH